MKNGERDHAASGPGGLPVFTSGWGTGELSFQTGDDFWARLDRIGAPPPIVAQMDAAMEGHSAPRIWLIMYEPDRPELAAAVALAFARELGAREQAALVLDCDDRSQALTAWAGRLESEGWIDLARYGTSVLTAGMPLPFRGRRAYLLGVGSFAPTDVTPDEIAHLMARLRRQADDLILVAPADATGEPWAAAAQIRLLCWDRAQRPAEDVATLAAGLAERGCPLDGLVGFGLPMGEPAPAPAAPPETPRTEAEPESAAAAGSAVDPLPAADELVTPAAATPAEPAPPADRPTAGPDDDGWTGAPPVAEAPPARRGTSGVFWFVTSAAVVIVAILGVYWNKYVRVPQGGPAKPVAAVSRPADDRAGTADRTNGDLANLDDLPAEPAPAGPDSLATGSVDLAADEAPATDQEATDREATGDQVTTGAPATSTATTEPAPAVATPVEPATAPVTESEPAAAPAFDMGPYRASVGDAGWALHLYSFPDSNGVKVELTELHRRGFETEVRVVETKDKGRWWRVYVGSFASRAEARDAAPLLKEKLRTDWANPTRF